MTMLYKAVEGAVEESHYGLALARVVPLPPQVLEDATYFAHKLHHRLLKKKKTSPNVINERRRKLILDLKEHLVQAYNGTMEGELLASWLKELQREFVNRMTAIDEDTARAQEDSEEEMNEDQEMRDRSVVDEEEGDGSYEERPSTHTSQPSVITIDSGITSTSRSSSTRLPSQAMSSVRAVSENER